MRSRRTFSMSGARTTLVWWCTNPTLPSQFLLTYSSPTYLHPCLNMYLIKWAYTPFFILFCFCSEGASLDFPHFTLEPFQFTTSTHSAVTYFTLPLPSSSLHSPYILFLLALQQSQPLHLTQAHHICHSYFTLFASFHPDIFLSCIPPPVTFTPLPWYLTLHVELYISINLVTFSNRYA